MGKDLQYVCLGPDGNGNMLYRVTVRYYRNCWDNSFQGQAASEPTTVGLEVSATGCSGFTTSYNLPKDPTAQPPNGTEVSQLCPAQLPQSGCSWSTTGSNPPYPGVEIYTYTGIVTVPAACGMVTFGTSDCCRNAAINNILNPGSEDLSIYAEVNNGIDPGTGQPYCNNSVAFTSQPVPFFCLGSNVTYNHGAVDVDGDSLVFALVNPMDGWTMPYANIAFAGGYTVTCPITTNPPNSFGFNTSNGQMSFVPALQEQDVLAVRVYEYRNGVLIGSTMRDIQVVILNCAIAIPNQNPITNVQNGNQVDSLSVQTCPGTPLVFDILCTDPANHNLTLSSNINSTPSAIPGAVLTQIGTGDTVTAHIAWTPAPGDTGCHNFILIAENNDCPINGTYTRVYSICVFTQVQLLTASTTYCGNPIQLTATGGTNFSWIPSSGPNGVSNPNIYNPYVTPVSPTMYYFSSDCGTDSVFVDVDPPFVFDAGPGGSICQNGQVNLNATTDNLYAPYDFHWTPAAGLLDPISGLPSDSVPNPVASPLVTTKYYCYITGSNGCINVDSVTVVVNGTGPNIVAKANPDTVCPLDPVTLSIVTNPQSCGASQTPCSGNIANGQIGAGVGQTPTGSATQYPTIFGHYSNSARHQFLYLAAEMLAQFPSGGEIRDISFYISQMNAPANDTLKSFEIKVGCTQATSLTSWQPNLTTVFTPKNIPNNGPIGWRTFALDVPYNWDGTSNLVVDICFYNPPGGPVALNNKMQMTPTAFNSVYYSKGNTSQCGNTGTPSSSMNRPNVQFNICITDVSNLPIAWTPSTGPNAPSPANNVVSTVANPESPQIYLVDVTALNGCHSEDFVYVYVDTSVRMYAFPYDTFFCNPVPVKITTTTYGSPIPGNTFNYEFKDLTSNTIVYSGTQDNFTVNPTSNTDYLVTLTGGVCTRIDTVHVRTGNSIPINLAIDSITCFGANDGGIKALPTGGTLPITYSWSTSATIDSIKNLAPGSYSVSITDNTGCTGSASVTLNEPTLLTVSGAKQDILCNGDNNGSISLTANGGTLNYNYTWNPFQTNSPNATGLTAQAYSTTVTDAHNCTATISFTITEPAALIVNVVPANASCETSNDGSATANVNGGIPNYLYDWDGTSGTSSINSLDNGNHTVVVTDANNCMVSSNFIVDTNYVLHVSASFTDATCFGNADGTATVTALNGTAAYNYLWNPSNQTTATATALLAGNYSVVVTDNVNCTASASVVISEPTEVVLSFSHTDPTCTGNSNGNATVNATGGTSPYNYDWAVVAGTNDPATANNLPAGVYDITVTDAINCSVTGSETLTNPPSLHAQFINITPITCANAQDGSVEVSVTGGTPPIFYSWSNGSTATVINNLAPGTYSVTVSDNNACDTILSTTFTAPPLISIAAINIDSVSCPEYTDGAIQVTATGGTPGAPDPYMYSIDGNNFQSDDVFNSLSAGVYHLTIRDGQGCLKDTIVTVYEPEKMNLALLPADSMIDLGNSITLVSNISNYSGTEINFYSWQPLNGLNCSDCPSVNATPYIHTEYTLTVNYLLNCAVSETVKVFVGNGEVFFVPNAFSPNGDGNNDVLMVYGSGLSKVNMRIFNRWGEKVFDSQNQWLGWDGTYKGVLQNPGVYTYDVLGTYLNGKVREKKGSVTLMR